MRTDFGIFLFLVALLLAPLEAQESLSSALKDYLSTVDEDEAALRLKQILAREDATGDALEKLVSTRPAPLRGVHRIFVPHCGLRLAVDIEAPTQVTGESLLPVMHCINWSSPPLHAALRGRAVLSEVPGYKPPQFGDEGRDAQVKIIRTVAFHTGGDPQALWFTGYSWGGHACWDQALHRPGLARGFIGRGGGPRRTFFRLFDNLKGARALAVCGGKDDPELVWNLREVRRIATKSRLDYKYWEAPDNGHDQPLPGEAEAGQELLLTPPPETPYPLRGTIVAEVPFVEHPLLRITEIDAKKAAVPKRISVKAKATADDQRRAVIRSMRKAVVSASWRIREKDGVKTISLQGKGVRAATLFLRAPWFRPGDAVLVKARGKKVFEGTLSIDPKVMLEEARRTGSRLHPVYSRIPLKL
jgi:pimeloyl-ACP methyl ester carboxylesterase